MIDPVESIGLITVNDMRSLVLMSKGHTQTVVAKMLGQSQPGIAKKIEKLNRIYSLQLTAGPKRQKIVNNAGMDLAAQFEEALNVLDGISTEGELRKKMVLIKEATKNLSDIGDSI